MALPYIKQIWYNLPVQTTALAADRLNHIEDGLGDLSQAVQGLQNAPVAVKEVYVQPNLPTGATLWIQTGLNGGNDWAILFENGL